MTATLHASAGQPAIADTEFERLYQQAYYRHSGFGPQHDHAASRNVRSFMPRQLRPGMAELAFAGLALVFFVVPAVTAALVV